MYIFRVSNNKIHLLTVSKYNDTKTFSAFIVNFKQVSDFCLFVNFEHALILLSVPVSTRPDDTGLRTQSVLWLFYYNS